MKLEKASLRLLHKTKIKINCFGKRLNE